MIVSSLAYYFNPEDGGDILLLNFDFQRNIWHYTPKDGILNIYFNFSLLCTLS
jgi:hypothetical protein